MSIDISYLLTEDHANTLIYNIDKSTMCSIMILTMVET